MAVVLGLVLRGDRLAPLRPRPLPAGARRACSPPSARTASSATRSSGTGRSRSSRLPFYNVASRRSFQTETIQPPLLAWAWRIAVGDPAAEPRIVAQAEWLAANRDLDGDGLLWIVQPDESGLDASPKFDPVWGRRANGRLGFPLLVAPQPTLGFDARRIRDRGGPVVCEVAGQHALVSLAAGSRPPLCRRRRWSIGSGTSSLGLFLDEVQPGGQRPRVLTWAALAPLALPDLPEEIGRRLVEEHLLSRAEFSTPVAPPSVAACEPAYEPDGGHGPIRRYWRGPTWVNAAWLIWIGPAAPGLRERGRRHGRGR